MSLVLQSEAVPETAPEPLSEEMPEVMEVGTLAHFIVLTLNLCVKRNLDLRSSEYPCIFIKTGLVQRLSVFAERNFSIPCASHHSRGSNAVARATRFHGSTEGGARIGALGSNRPPSKTGGLFFFTGVNVLVKSF